MNDEIFDKGAKCLKTIAHPIRLKMIKLLLENKYSIKELSEICNVKHNVASEHLSLMKDRGFISSEKEKTKVYYFIKEKGLKNIINCIETKFN